MRKIILLTVFFILTPLVLIFSALYLSFLVYQKAQPDYSFLNSESANRVAYAALPTNQDLIKEEIEQKDARVEVVKQFFKRNFSELEPYAEDVVKTADKYNLDYRLVPAIAMQESNLCKKSPFGSYNCWGYGIYGKQTIKFDSYPEAIETVTKTLSQEYKIGMGLETPSEIMTKYTPQNDGSWAKSVTFFMDGLQITP